jgi:hypothetical protein
MASAQLSIRAGHPDFLDLDWSRPVEEWPAERTVDLPTGIHRHPVVFVPYHRDIYAVKELPLRAARHEYAMLRLLWERQAPAVEPVGAVERPWLDPHDEGAGVVISRYLDYTISYRELLEGDGFGARRNQMLNAFANLLVELHVLGCFWGDASLSNVIYRFDAEALQVTMVDAETVEIHEELTTGQRLHDLDIMVTNVAAGMADIAASHGDLDQADTGLGDDIAARYHDLWNELTHVEELDSNERYRISGRIRRLNELGYEVDDVRISAGTEKLRLVLKVGGRRFHSSRLRALTGIDATEGQARVILGDLRYHQSTELSPKSIAAIRWRVDVFEPLLERIREEGGPTANPVQGYADFLNHRYLIATEAMRDVGNDEAFARWVGEGMPGYPLH